MSTIKVTNVQNPSAASAAITLDTNGQATLNGLAYPTSGSLSGRNRVINGAMVIDARNAGASVTPTVSGTYTVDRWNAQLSVASKFSVQQNAGSVTPPAGFSHYLGATSLSAYTTGSSDFFGLEQRLEGFNMSDLAFGTASAKPLTISFYVRSSLTGTFGGAIYNDTGNRCYPFSYSISSANTWEQKSITIAGDTSGTWLTGNGIGLQVIFSLGAGSSLSGTAGSWGSTLYRSATGATSVVGTNGATFYITGVQLEQGSTATPFERRSYGQELALCQRYYYKMVSGSSFGRFGPSYNGSTTAAQAFVTYPVSMRSAPSALEQSGTAADYAVLHQQTSTVCSVVPAFNTANTYGSTISLTVASGLIAGQGGQFSSASGISTAYLAWSAEL